MSQSLLFKLARESITEVFEAKSIIDKEQILGEYPVLNEDVSLFIHLYIDKELRGSSGSIHANTSLLDAIIFHAKAAAFQDEVFGPLTVSQYLKTSLEISLLTPLTAITYTSIEDLKNKILPKKDGVYLKFQDKEAWLLPRAWSEFPSFTEFISELLTIAGIQIFSTDIQIFSFAIEKSHDKPILE